MKKESNAKNAVATLVALVVILALVPIYAIGISSTGVGMVHDDGIYVTTGKAIADGRGYRIEGYPVEIPQTKYPPVLPALISLVWRISPHFPENVPFLKAIPVFAAIAWFVLLFYLFRRSARFDTPVVLWLLVLVFANQWSLYTTQIVVSEGLFSVFAIAAIYFLAGAGTGTVRDKHVLVASLFASAGYLTRTAGVALIGGGLIYLVLEKRFRQALLFTMCSAPFVLAWIFWQHQTATNLNPVEAYYTSQNYSDWNVILSSDFTQSNRIAIVVSNAIRVWIYPIEVIFPLTSTVHLAPILVLVLPVPFWICIVAGVRRAPRQLASAAWFAVLTIGMCLLWTWPPDRLMLPLLPLFVMFGYFGYPRGIPHAAALVLFPVSLYVVLLAAQNTAAHGVGSFAPRPGVGADVRQSSNWSQVAAVHDWVSANTPPDAVVLANFDPAMYLYTGRKSMRPFTMEGPEVYFSIHRPLDRKIREVEQVIEKYHANYLAETGHDMGEEPDFHAIVEALQGKGLVQLVAHFGPEYRIWAINPLSAVPQSR